MIIKVLNLSHQILGGGSGIKFVLKLINHAALKHLRVGGYLVLVHTTGERIWSKHNLFLCDVIDHEHFGFVHIL